MESGTGAQLQEKNQCYSHPQRTRRRTWETTGKSALTLPWKGDGTDHSGVSEGSSAIKATVVYRKKNGKMN